MPKTLAIRLDDDQHAQAALMAQLLGMSLTELIRNAIDSYVEARRSDPDVLAKADAIREQIEAEAATRQAAIETLFVADDPGKAAPKARRTRKPAADADA